MQVGQLTRTTDREGWEDTYGPLLEERRETLGELFLVERAQARDRQRSTRKAVCLKLSVDVVH
jgi:hypothetical protein